MHISELGLLLVFWIKGRSGNGISGMLEECNKADLFMNRKWTRMRNITGFYWLCFVQTNLIINSETWRYNNRLCRCWAADSPLHMQVVVSQLVSWCSPVSMATGGEVLTIYHWQRMKQPVSWMNSYRREQTIPLSNALTLFITSGQCLWFVISTVEYI